MSSGLLVLSCACSRLPSCGGRRAPVNGRGLFFTGIDCLPHLARPR